ncbi:MAG: glycosyltransferase family 2 protein [Candidatus Promineifilaceae bacterium]|nr:glycosyltransferase family 2 protein [Candidatus Promineifilaceae bacterium]
MIDLSVIIVSWNTVGLLDACLASIMAHPPACEFEVIVVDNASTDGSAQMVHGRYPDVKVIENERNVGFARANNQGLRTAVGRHLLLLNPDTEVRPNALETLMRFLERHEGAGAAGARILNPDGTLQPSCYPAPTLLNEWLHLFHLDRNRRGGMEEWDVMEPRAVEVLLGACIMVRREALDDVGYLDERFFMYSEEVDFCYRLQKAGWSLYWVPQAQVVHHGGQSTRQAATDMFLRLYEGKLLYFRKHYGPGTARLYKVILLLGSLSRLALLPFTWLERPPRRAEHQALAGRYWRLMRALPAL